MSLRRTLAAICCITLPALVPGVAAGQGSPRIVPLESRAYDLVDQLAAAGLIRTMIHGQRPYTRAEVARLTVEARRRLDADLDGRGDARARRLARIVQALELEYAPDAATWRDGSADAVGISGVMTELTVLDSERRPIEDVGLGAVDAVVNPLAQGRGGRRYGEDLTAAVEGAAYAAWRDRLAVQAHLRASTTGTPAGQPGGSAPAVEARAMSATADVANVLVGAGRIPVLLGQGMHGGLLASSNAPALDMVLVSTNRSVLLPGFLRHLGPTRGAIFLADLGVDQHFPHTRMAGWKVSVLPSPALEVGASLLSVQGGKGAPGARFHERVIDVFTLIDVLAFQDRDLLFSNKLAGIDVRARIGGSQVYFEGVADDFDVRRVRSSIWEDAGLLAGVVLPPLGAAGTVRIAAELQHTGLRYYQHGQFRSGVTSRQTIIGIPLGPRGDAAIGRATWARTAESELTATVALERRSGDRYEVSTAGPDDSGWQFLKVDDLPEETRARALVGYATTMGRGTGRLDVEAGLERVANDLASGGARTNALGRMTLTFGFW